MRISTVAWYETVFELIDLRSFSNLWFWIVLAVIWSSTSHWVLGVPWDMVMRAKRKQSEQSVQDLRDIIRINTNRIHYIMQESGLLLIGIICFLLTALLLLGFVYGNEFSQALFLLSFPGSIVGLTSVRTAYVITNNGLQEDALIARLQKHRIITQFIGIISIFVTAMWGMLQNISLGALG